MASKRIELRLEGVWAVAFGDHAKALSDATGLVLATNELGELECGFLLKRIDEYAAVLLNRGITIEILPPPSPTQPERTEG